MWAWLELGVFAGGIVLYALYIHNMVFCVQVVIALGAVALCVLSNRLHGEGLGEIGLRLDNTKETCLMLLPYLVISGMALLYFVMTSEKTVFNSNFFWALLLYPFWAIVQQYLFQGFFS